MIIAVDGPAASGKGTLARRLAAHYGFAYLDTGSLYRAVALQMRRGGADLGDEAVASATAAAIDDSLLEDPELRTAATGEAASVVAAMPGVREAVLDFQRRFAAQEPGAVLDGRDIGTVVCPDARAKLFVTASIEVRAHRRYLELARSGEPINEETVKAALMERDARDRARPIAPLRQAADAVLLDTTELDIETAFRQAVEIIDRQRE
ncbi:cytidylate kinase [Rhodoligotrophos appendicifer]|uniref:(d)CMP kinase n=1 Tax=Rhodoligotrophos appendicifer TaxID=987056 RepID=UPI001180140B|nr:(d)CMP kinase [Rhodoligotrophos appendicifer]